jgi:hypothetical protein
LSSFLFKFAALGIPAIVFLLWWRRIGVVSKGLYKSSWTNVGCYLAWLSLGLLANRTAGMGAVIGILIGVPLVAVGFSLVLMTWSRFAKQGERWTMALANLLMLLLWTSSVIAPN